MSKRTSGRQPITEAHVRLGSELRRVRDAARVNTRSIPSFSPGHISNVENGYVAPSEALVETYVRLFGGDATIYALYEQMRHAAARRSQQQRLARRSQLNTAPRPPRSLEDVTSQEDITKHYVTEAHEAHFLFSEFGSILQMRVRVWLRARTPEVRLYYAGAYYDAERGRGILQAEALEGASFIDQEEDSVGAIRVFFELNRTLDPDDTRPHFVSYVVHVNSNKRAQPQLVYYARHGMVRLNLRATFNAAMHPQQLWTFGAPNMVNIRHRPEDELRPDDDLDFNYEFSPTIPGWCYGFSWLW
jgi:hypothetical protein